MDRKTKIIAVLAAGALAILVGSSVARCTLAQDGGEAGPDPVWLSLIHISEPTRP